MLLTRGPRRDAMQVCLNGHVINTMVMGEPEYNKRFCDDCGARTIDSCPACGESIPGYLEGDGISLAPTPAPAFCQECGERFPWNEPGAGESSAQELPTAETGIRVFISHSSADADHAEMLADAIQLASRVPGHQIRCTSAPGHGLTAGAHTSVQLREELAACDVVIGLLTATSVESAWVLFELGAAWGRNGWVAPVLYGNFSAEMLPGPLAERHSVRAVDESAVLQLLHDVAARLGAEPFTPKMHSCARRIARSAGAVRVR